MTNFNPLTLDTVCEFFNMDVPDHLKEFSGYAFSRATSSWSLPNDNSLHFCAGDLSTAQLDKLLSAGIPAVVAEKQMFDSRGRAVPTLVHPDPAEAYTLLMRAMKRENNAKTVAVTGSNGKTTCRELIRLIASTEFNTHYSRGNSNVFGRIGNTIQRMPSETEVYIQETGAAAPGIIERAAQMLEPDAALVTNIGFAHIGEYGGKQEKLLEDKLSLDRYLSENGVFFVNFDDPVLRGQQFHHLVISYGLDAQGVDYTAEDIYKKNDGFEFTIVENSSGVRTPARIHAIGIHNVSNAVAAFAVGRWLGIPHSGIVAGIGQYRSQGTRQNLIEVNGQKVLVDSFNATEVSMVSVADALQGLSLPDAGRRILVLADIPRLGDHAERIHREVGRRIADFKGIDRVYCFGPSSRWIMEELRHEGKYSFHSSNRVEFNERLISDLSDTDVVAFKGGAPMALSLTVDAVFCTDFHYSNSYKRKTRQYVRDNAKYRIVKDYGAVFVGLSGLPSDGALKVGGNVSEIPIVQIGRRSCANTDVRSVVIEPPVRTVGRQAYARCTDLISVDFPSTLRVISSGAFQGCSELEGLRLPEGLTTIHEDAFQNCVNLKRVTIPRSVKTISPGAFSGCPQLVVQCYEGTRMAATMQSRLSERQFQLI